MLQTDGSFYLYLAFIILCLPFPWVTASLLAAAFHEVCHLAVLYFLEGEVRSIQLKAGGAVIHANFSSLRQELLCAAAGPIGSILLLFLYRLCPRVSLCAGLQGIVNLFPLYPLDGGRITNCIFGILVPHYADELQQCTEIAFLLTFLIAITIVSSNSTVHYPLLLPLLFFLVRKIPCKQRKIRVQ